MPSEMAGPAFLSILLAAGLVLALRRRRAPPEPRLVLPAACLTLAAQAVHVAEEFSTGFHHRLPMLLGLERWSDPFFLWFNLGWIALWSLACASLALGRAGLPAVASLWFLAIAAVGNAIWHPLLSLTSGAYFPGTVSALPLGIGGFVLARRLDASAGLPAPRR